MKTTKIHSDKAVSAITIDASLEKYKNAFPEKLARANKLLESVEFRHGIEKKRKSTNSAK